ncbi:MAG TPA: hypothetical protein DCL41_00575 [Bdellovibrionales bacterium]|nr:hypothetical protein [Bdellovibrionales bacterium]
MNEDVDWWWIDYLEGELDPTTEPDIEFLLEKSATDQKNFESWKLLKTWVKEVDPAKETQWASQELGTMKSEILKTLTSSSQGLSESSHVTTRVF